MEASIATVAAFLVAGALCWVVACLGMLLVRRWRPFAYAGMPRAALLFSIGLGLFMMFGDALADRKPASGDDRPTFMHGG